MKGFSFEVKLYVLDRRHEGKAWKEITQGIKERFNINPPTVRAMQKWEKELDRETLNRALMEEAKRRVPEVKQGVLGQMAGGLIPVLWQARDLGGDIELEGWIWFLRVFEHQLGSEKFEQVVSEYLKRRNEEKEKFAPAS
jgi:hypothetical protein